MAEYKVFENDEVRDLVLKYADRKYQFALMHKHDKDLCPDTIWSLHETEEEVLRQKDTETAAYQDSSAYQFYCCAIKRDESVCTAIIDGKKKTKRYKSTCLIPLK